MPRPAIVPLALAALLAAAVPSHAQSLSIADVSVVEPDTGTRALTFPVTLAPASGSTVTVNWATAPGSATEGVDYVGKSGTLTFWPGQTLRNISVAVVGD